MVTVKENGALPTIPTAALTVRTASSSAPAGDTGGAKFGQGTIDVTPVNLAPLLDLEWGYTTMNTSGQFKAEDPDGDPIAWKLEASPAHGTVQVDAGELIDMLPMKTISGTTVFAYRLKMDVADVRRAICWSLSGRRQIEFRNRFTFMPHPAAPIRAFSHPRTI